MISKQVLTSCLMYVIMQTANKCKIVGGTDG